MHALVAALIATSLGASAGCLYVCDEFTGSETAYEEPRLVANDERALVWWKRHVRRQDGMGDDVVVEGATVDRDGAIGPTVDLDVLGPDNATRGVIGSRSVLWTIVPEERPTETVTVGWWDGGEARTMVLAEQPPLSIVASFAGSEYVVYWTSEDQRLFSRRIAEDGTLSPTQEIAHSAYDVMGVAHGDQHTLLFTATELGSELLLAALGTDAFEPLDHSAYIPPIPSEIVWFAGRFHLRNGGRAVVNSIDPVTRAVEEHLVTDEGYARLVAGTNSLYAITDGRDAAIVTLDGGLNETARFAIPDDVRVAVLDNLPVHTDNTSTADASTQLQLVARAPDGSEGWRATLATSSPPVHIKSCETSTGW